MRRRTSLVGCVLGIVLVGLGVQAGCRTASSIAVGNVRASWDGFGSAICVLPSTGDAGGARILVGAPMASRSGEDPTGALYEVAWPGGGVKEVRRGTQPHERYAESLCLMADLNGDGAPEVAVGCPGASGDAGDWCGKVEILSGRDYAPVRDVWGTEKGQRFGTMVVASGESGALENSVVAVKLDIPVVLENLNSIFKGAVVFNADMTVRRWEIAPKTGWEGVGEALLTCPDLDGDGVPEIGISVPWAAKEGRVMGRYSILSGKSGRTLFEHWGSEEYGMLGTSACVVPSSEAADRFLLVLGAPRFERNGMPLGRVQVFGVPSNRLVHERVGTTVGADYGGSVGPLMGAGRPGQVARTAFAVASSQRQKPRVSGVSATAGSGYLAGSGYVEGVQVGGEMPSFAVEGLQPWGLLGDVMLWSDSENLLLLGSAGFYDAPSLRDLDSRSFICVIPGGAPARGCRVFTSQGEVPQADLGRFVRFN